MDLQAKKILSRCIEEFESNTQIEFKLIIEKKAGDYRFYSLCIILLISFLFWGIVLLLEDNFDFKLIYLESVFLVIIEAFILEKLYFIKFFIPKSLKNKINKQRALYLFSREKIFKTKLRSGMLLYFSRLENKGIFIVDEGVAQRINSEQLDYWQAQFQLALQGKNIVEELGSFIRSFGIYCHRIWPDETFTDELSNEVLED